MVIEPNGVYKGVKNRTGVTYGLLYGNAPLWSEKANGPVVRRLELDPLLCYAAELGQRHHLKEHEVFISAAKRNLPPASRKSRSVGDPCILVQKNYFFLIIFLINFPQARYLQFKK
jgi:hypothetical protein